MCTENKEMFVHLNDEQFRACVDIIKALSKDNTIQDELYEVLTLLCDDRFELSKVHSSKYYTVVFQIATRIKNADNIEQEKDMCISCWEKRIL